MIAFAATKYTKRSLDDPAYVKWFARTRVNQSGKKGPVEEIPMHKCSYEQMDQFHEPREDSI